MPAEPPSDRRAPELETLVGLFYDQPERLGQFTEVEPDEMPEAPRRLLNHHAHMTVTVESFHQSSVDVEVLEDRADQDTYWRKILLRRQSDGGVVQFGIVRLDFRYVSEPVRREIEEQGTPLGRVLINHDVLRKVELHSLWRVAPGPELRELLGLTTDEPVYGRTALIYCNGEPAVELLEIVTSDGPDS